MEVPESFIYFAVTALKYEAIHHPEFHDPWQSVVRLPRYSFCF